MQKIIDLFILNRYSEFGSMGTSVYWEIVIHEFT